MDRPAVQFIDENGVYNEGCHNIIRQWSPIAPLPIRVVSIMGLQQGGKSTLLNRIFGTSFEVNGRCDQRRQTEGMWASHSIQRGSFFMLFDVEGYGGLERIRHREFEGWGTVHSMVTSDVLIINILDQILNTDGGGRPLIRMMLENGARLQVTPGRKVTLLFVVRDMQGRIEDMDSQGSVRRERIMSMLQELWRDMPRRGAGGADRQEFDDLFDVRVFCLPPLVIMGTPVPQAEEFLAELREWFFNPANANYLFKDTMGKRYRSVDELLQLSASVYPRITSDAELRVMDEYRLRERTACTRLREEQLGAYRREAGMRDTQLNAAVHDAADTAALAVAVGRLGAETDGAAGRVVAQFDADAPHVCEEVFAAERVIFTQDLATERGRFDEACRARIHERHVKECEDKREAVMARLREMNTQWEQSMRAEAACKERTISNPTQAMADARNAEISAYAEATGRQPWSDAQAVAANLQELRVASQRLVDEISSSFEGHKKNKLEQMKSITTTDVWRVVKGVVSAVGVGLSVVGGAVATVACAPVAVPALAVAGAASFLNGFNLGDAIGDGISSSEETKRKAAEMDK